MPLSDTNSPSGVSTGGPEVARTKLHLSPQAMQAIYLKGLILGAQKAARSAKVTSCLLSMWYTDHNATRRTFNSGRGVQGDKLSCNSHGFRLRVRLQDRPATDNFLGLGKGTIRSSADSVRCANWLDQDSIPGPLHSTRTDRSPFCVRWLPSTH